MKKWLVRTVLPALMVGMLTGCGGDAGGESRSSAGSDPVASSPKQETLPPAPEVDGDIFNNPNAVMLGGTVCDYLYQQAWGGGFKDCDPLKAMKENGMNWVRVGALMVDDPQLDETPFEKWGELSYKPTTWSSKEYAKRILQDADRVGLRKNLFYFLGDTAVSGEQQNAPTGWNKYSVEKTAEELEKYCYETTKYFMDAGLTIDLYDLGNENERGILNFRPDERIPRPANVDVLTNIEWMRENVWPTQATLFKACIKGIKKADPDAKINIHASTFGYSGNLLVLGFFEAMKDFGVDYDVCGVSYYWNCINGNMGLQKLEKEAYWKTSDWQEFAAEIKKLGKIFIFSEIQYPNDNEIASIDYAPDSGYPFTPEGQAAWLSDFLDFCESDPIVSGSIYFYPDYFPMMTNMPYLNICGLFGIDRNPNPGMLAYREFAERWNKKYKDQ